MEREPCRGELREKERDERCIGASGRGHGGASASSEVRGRRHLLRGGTAYVEEDRGSGDQVAQGSGSSQSAERRQQDIAWARAGP